MEDTLFLKLFELCQKKNLFFVYRMKSLISGEENCFSYGKTTNPLQREVDKIGKIVWLALVPRDKQNRIEKSLLQSRVNNADNRAIVWGYKTEKCLEKKSKRTKDWVYEVERTASIHRTLNNIALELGSITKGMSLKDMTLYLMKQK